jgi:DNA mismatch repair ATPase MutS
MSADDAVQRGRSYYCAELDTAKAMLEPTAPGTRALVVVDELFRGTNTTERIGAGKAVLAGLQQRGHFVIASTHDRELVGLLRDGYDAYHLGEHVDQGELVFPYTLHPGPSTTRNAIVLMAAVGLPTDVVADAMRTTEALERERAS